METADAARGGRRHNLSLRQLTPLRPRRESSLERSFESFYRKYVAEVYQYALAVLTNPADAEDVTQQTFLNAYRAFQRGERPHTPHNWLIKIAHNVCRMRWRQSSRRPQEVPLEQVREPVALDDEKPSLDAVLGALARLPFNQRAAIVMREVEGRSYAEIADVLETTVPAVEALLFRARTNLRSRRKTLGILTAAPLPGSLSSSFGGGGILAAGGAALGSEVVLKVAAIVAGGLVMGGLGFKAVTAVARPEQTPTPVQQAGYHATPAWADPVQSIVGARNTRSGYGTSFAGMPHAPRGTGGGDELRSVPTNDRASATGLGGAPANGTLAAGSAAAGTAAEPGTPANTVVGSVPAPAPPATPVPLPPPPPLPSVTVTTPSATAPSVTVPSVTVPSVTVPTVTVPTITPPPPPVP
jgi:RNA polymerase sigma-70 factor (ECF subfamily)